jgi:P4 family phage/plasmid primase-like protien
LTALAGPDDLILIRPVETWEDATTGKKCSQVFHKSIFYVPGVRQQIGAITRALRNASEVNFANLFFGVCPRLGRNGEFDLAAQIRKAPALWVDHDNATPPEFLSLCEAAVVPRPSALVSSGRGTHAYWIFRAPVLIDDAPPPPAVKKEWREINGKKRPIPFYTDPETKEKRYLADPETGRPLVANQLRLSPKALHIQDTAAGLAAAIGADTVGDLSRLFRLPGTENRKNQRNGKEPVPCELLELNGLRYDLADFERFAEKSPTRERRKAIESYPLPSSRKPGSRKAERLQRLAWECGQADDRSESDFALCCWAVENAVPPETVWDAVQSVGKFAERGRDYFERTWDKATGHTREKLFAEHEQRSSPPGRRDLARESEDCDGDTAADHPAGSLINEEFDDPHALARYVRQSLPHLKLYHGDVLTWKCPGYERLSREEFKAAATAGVKRRFDEIHERDRQIWIRGGTGPKPVVAKVGRGLIADVLQAIESDCLVGGHITRPAWLDAAPFEATECVATTSAIVHIPGFVTGAKPESYSVPPTPEFFAANWLPYDFDPTADCPKWLAFLDKVFESDPQRIAITQEFFGLCLLPDTSFQKFIVAEGFGANGKSVWCAALTACIGPANCSHVPLEGFGGRFQLNQTLGKLANIAAEVGELDKVAEGFLKSFTSGDRMQFERKHKDPIEMIPTARLVLCTNNRPRFSDRSSGLWRRMIVLPFNVTITEAERVVGMDKPEWWRQQGELPGMLNWAIAGFHRLRRQGKFSESEVSRTALAEYRLENNPAQLFLNAFYEAAPLDDIVTAEVYGEYRHWCENSGYRPLSAVVFGKEIIRKFPNGKKAKIWNSDGKRAEGYQGIGKKKSDNPDNSDREYF